MYDEFGQMRFRNKRHALHKCRSLAYSMMSLSYGTCFSTIEAEAKRRNRRGELSRGSSGQENGSGDPRSQAFALGTALV